MAKAKKQDNASEPTDPKPAKATAKKTDAAAPAATPAATPVEAAAPEGKAKKASKAKSAPKAEAPAGEVKAATAPAAAPAPAAKPAEAPAAKPAAKPAAAATPKAAPKAAKAAAPAQKPAAPAGSKPAFPGIDTNLAARAAANLVANRDLLGGLNLTPTASAGQPKPAGDAAKPEAKVESTSFKNLKQNLAQPTAGLNKMLGFSSNTKKGGLPFAGGGPGAKGQSSGGGAGGGNKLGVPRRTSGG
ncbi:hypothetical protein [Humisphaera borealis]|uniref:Uncharacterized protein n=1 Tax=Humisphaera borealis TaxID=2807512 RepID=A0A7M2X5F3_9BACT|nr:hypothetical protein [Humisphaera borealis]QOV92281.1 hypothetical protein IPV69_13350 [Humisphaera borealis]